ncbi:putative quinol monooxygenase [Kitasatospora sp. KL5]|uniref:putative quinol monooxygenase n=1 Tax=Kitasatospora sp. KL5 TaxID=3425125 RepID=UPI003D6F2DCB
MDHLDDPSSRAWPDGLRQSSRVLGDRDIAGITGCAAALPRHVNLAQITVLPTAQVRAPRRCPPGSRRPWRPPPIPGAHMLRPTIRTGRPAHPERSPPMRPARALLTAAVTAALLAGAAPGASAARPGATMPNLGDSSVAYTVISAYEHIPAAARAAFVAAAQQEGYASRRHEPGTESVHVVPDPEHPDRIVVAETFASEPAYQVHRTGRHARRFAALAALLGVTGPSTTVANYSLPTDDGTGRVAPSRGDNGRVFTVVAEFGNVQPEFREEFVKVAQADGYLSLTGEPGTIGFHFVPDAADPTRFVFLETFTDEAAFQAHATGAPAKAYLEVVAKAHIVGPHFFVTRVTTGFDRPGGWSVPNRKA